MYENNNNVILAGSQISGDMYLVNPADSTVAKDISLSQYGRLWMSGNEGSGASALRPPRDTFGRVLWVYRCIYVTAMNAAKLPLRLSRDEASGTRRYAGLKRIRYGRDKKRGDACRAKELRGNQHVAKARDGEIIECGDLFDLLERPNPEQTWNQFLKTTIACLLTPPGRVHWLFDEMRGNRPLTMYVLPGSRTIPKYDDTGRIKHLTHWELQLPRGGRVPMLLDECITFAGLNPNAWHEGLSPVTPGSLAIVSDYNASQYNAAMFGNNCEPGGVMETDSAYNEENDQQIKTGWATRHGGSLNARKLAILWGGLKYSTIASTMADMQFGEGKKLTRTETCAAFGVPEVVAGFYSDANYAFAKQGRQQFYEETLFPLLDELAEGIQVHLVSRFGGGLDVWFDAENSPIVQEMRNSNLEAVDKLWAKGVPLGDLNDLYDLGIEDRSWHATGFLPLGISPASEIAAGGFRPDEDYDEGDGSQEDSPEEDGQSAGGSGQSEEEDGQLADGSGQSGGEPSKQRPTPKSQLPTIEEKTAEAVWTRWMRSWSPLVRTVRSTIRSRLYMQERKILAALKEVVSSRESGAGNEEAESRKRKAESKAPGLVGRILFDVFGDKKDRVAWRAKVRAFLTDANELGLRQAMVEAGFKDDALREAMRRLMAHPRIIANIQRDSIIVSTRVDDRVKTLLRKQLAQGLAAGEDMRKLADRVQHVMGNSRKSAVVQARNAVGQALSDSRHQGHKAAGMKYKTWMHSRGPGERRPEHIKAEQRYRNAPIPMDEYFDVAGERLMYPRDYQHGSPGNTINCQCLQLASRTPKDFGPQVTRLLAVGFVPYTDVLAVRQAPSGESSVGGPLDKKGE